MSAVDLNAAVLVFTAVVVAALVGLRLSHRLGMPTLLFYLAIGLVLGESGLGVQFSDPDLTQLLSTLMLAVILIEGGFTTRAAEIRPVAGLAGVLASVGVLLTVAVTAGLTYLLLDIDVRTAVLLGAVVASTDAAATFAVLRRLPLRPRTRAALEAESGFNDPPVIILVTVVASEAWHTASATGMAATVVYQLAAGAAIGALVSLAGRAVLSRVALPTAGLYPLAVLAIALAAFALAGIAGASGLLAGYVAGVFLGNSRLPHHGTTRAFTEGLASLGQIVLFVMLGLLASPSRLPEAIIPALVVGAVLTFLARPIAVALCATPFRVPLREQAFMSWAGLRGAVPIVVATIPMSNGLPAAERIFDVVFLLVVVFTLIQGPLLPTVARLTGVLESGTSREVAIESAPLEDIEATLIQVTVTPGSRLHGVRIEELYLPQRAVVALVLREGRALASGEHMVLRTGDHVLIATPEADQVATERRLRAVSRAGRLANWFGESGDVTSSTEVEHRPDGPRARALRALRSSRALLESRESGRPAREGPGRPAGSAAGGAGVASSAKASASAVHVARSDPGAGQGTVAPSVPLEAGGRRDDTPDRRAAVPTA